MTVEVGPETFKFKNQAGLPGGATRGNQVLYLGGFAGCIRIQVGTFKPLCFTYYLTYYVLNNKLIKGLLL